MTAFAHRIVAATALTLVSAGASMAADLPARMAPPAYVAPIPVFTWTGAYFGINAGAAFDNKQEFTTTANRSDGIGSTRFSDNGFTAGGQIGYNYQFGGFGGPGGIVVGFEADADVHGHRQGGGVSPTRRHRQLPLGTELPGHGPRSPRLRVQPVPDLWHRRFRLRQRQQPVPQLRSRMASR